MKTLLHCHHSVGLGHFQRTLQLATALVDEGPVCLICGGEIPQALPIPDGVRLQGLPPLNMRPNGVLYDPSGRDETDDLLWKRAGIVVDTVRRFRPDAVVVEMFPFGRKKLVNEILGLINTARASSNAKVFSSVRDVLVTARRDQARHDDRALRWLNGNFDELLVHSDPKFITLDATFSTYDEIDIPIHYTGYVARRCRRTSAPREPRIVVSAGGGRVGKRLIETCVKAHAELRRRFGFEMFIVSGPLHDELPDLRGIPGITTQAFVEDLPALLATSRLSISQCGYNTAVEVADAGIPAVFVPYEAEREDEQLRRANCLGELGVGVTLRECDLNTNTLINAVRQLMAGDSRRHEAHWIDLNGALASKRIIKDRVADGRA